MPETTAITTPGGDPITTPPATPANPDNGGESTVIDFSKIGDENFNKVLEDPRLWNNPRIKELREKADAAKTYEAEKAKKEQEDLKKKGDFETLAAQKETKIQELTEKFNSTLTNSAIIAEAAKLGITDLDAATKLIDRANIKVNDDGTVSGVTEAVAALAKDRAYLVTGQARPVSRGTNPPDPNSTQSTFKMSEIRDPVFYAKHFAEIQKALATPGSIDYDN